MSGLTWLNDLMVWLGRWFPRLILVRAGHSAVKFGMGGAVTEIEPSLHMYWPITSEIVVVSRLLRTTEIASMLCGREAISLVVKYSVRHPMQLVLTFNDVFSMLDDMTQAALLAAYRDGKPDEEIEQHVLKQLAKELEPIIGVHSVSIISRGPVIALKNLTDWAQHSAARL